MFIHPEREVWDGPRAGQAGACRDYLADESFPIDDFASKLPGLLEGREVVHYPIGMDDAFDRLLIAADNQVRAKVRSGNNFPCTFKDIAPTIHEMRLFKSAAEIAVMRKAIEISAKAHQRAMQACRPGMYEYELEAELLYEFKKHGSDYPAYNTIVGAGRNSCILHYIQNDQLIADGSLVLIDAGAEYQNYAADITRTFPANGRFTTEQREIYELVLAAQHAAIQTIKPGVSFTKAQEVVVRILTQGLIDLKILKGTLNELIEKQAFLPFYMHRSGHWLGLDVHDVGAYKVGDAWRSLSPGMVLTIEPGIYIADLPHVDKKWHHIGVRIEDDVLVTEKGCEVLSQMLPKTTTDIESIMKR